jgi:HPt (histidine-containing phosphotransfer) domain-containing protein
MRKLSRIVEELVPGYLAARKREVPQMLELLAGSDFERLRILSHSLKGSGGSFGFPELTAFGAALERHAQRGDGAAFGAELSRLKDYLDHLNWSPAEASPDERGGV